MTPSSQTSTNTDSLKTPIIWGITSSVGIIISGIIAYVIKFYDHSFSDKPEVWGQLGDYLNMFVSAGSLILVSVLTYIIHQSETRRAEEQSNADALRANEKEEDEKARNRPVLVFIAYRDFSKGPTWKIKNISHNVALNILVSFTKEQADVWDLPVMIYSLGPGEEHEITWFRAALQICAVYYDVRGNVLTSIIQQDRVQIHLGVNVLNSFATDQYIRRESVTVRG